MAEMDEDQPESRRGPNLICQDMQGGPPIGGGQWHTSTCRTSSLSSSVLLSRGSRRVLVCLLARDMPNAAMDLEALGTDQKAIKSKLEPFSEENQTSPI